jgi:hypothetical protein
VDPADRHDRQAGEFDEATTLESLPEAVRALLESFVDGLGGPHVLDAARGTVEDARAHRQGQYLRMDVRSLGLPARRVEDLFVIV